MLLKDLREQVLDANLELVRRGLVLYTFGNVSGISRADGLIAIKPSGVPYETMKAEDIVVTDLEGKVVETTLRPSSDLATHVELYKRFPKIGGVATLSRSLLPRGRRLAGRSLVSEPHMPIIFMVRFQ